MRGIENDIKTINFRIKMKLSRYDKLSIGLKYKFCLTDILNLINLKIYAYIFHLY